MISAAIFLVYFCFFYKNTDITESSIVELYTAQNLSAGTTENWRTSETDQCAMNVDYEPMLSLVSNRDFKQHREKESKFTNAIDVENFVKSDENLPLRKKRIQPT